MEQISFTVAEYTAPLELILHLITKHKLDITDIDISSLLEQYLSAIEGWKKQNLDISSEFLQMASRLVYMKTVSLLPRHKEESEQLRKDLAGELMEYHICKIAAEALNKTNSFSDSFVRPAASIEIDSTYKGSHSSYILFNALADALGQSARRLPPPKESFAPLVTAPFVSVSTKLFTVLRILRSRGETKLVDFFDPSVGKSGLVATFLAILELLKSGKIWLEEDIISLCKDENKRKGLA